MSLYREPGRVRRRRRLIALAALIAVALAALVVIAVAGGAPSHAERLRAAQGAAGLALDGLELVEIEYAQAVKDGRVVAPTEFEAARADVQRARGALREHREDLQVVDVSGLERAERALDAVRATVERRASPADLKDAVAAARATIEPLAR